MHLIIDMTCADTWCEGDYDFKFTDLNCNNRNFVCTLGVKVIDREIRHTRQEKCTFEKITSKEKIIYKHALTDNFYDQLNDCITRLENSSL